MLALKYYGPRDIRLEKVPIPKVGEKQVLVKVTDAGISQTQINEFIEGPFIINELPHPLTGKSIPLIPCQEYGGIIEDVGKGVDKSIVGKKVAVLPLVSCGKCEYCKKGVENLCDKMAYYGLIGIDGGFAEYSIVDIDNIYFIDREDAFTFVEPILVGLNTIDIFSKFAKTTEKLRVLVLGAGALGISVGIVWKYKVKADVFINDLIPFRMKKAEIFGLIPIEKEKIKQDSFDIVIDAAGMDPFAEEPAYVEGLRYVKKGSFLINVGTYFHPLKIIPSYALMKQKHVISSIAYRKEVIKELDSFFKNFNESFFPLIEEIPLERIIEEGYYRAEIEKESFVRLVTKC